MPIYLGAAFFAVILKGSIPWLIRPSRLRPLPPPRPFQRRLGAWKSTPRRPSLRLPSHPRRRCNSCWAGRWALCALPRAPPDLIHGESRPGSYFESDASNLWRLPKTSAPRDARPFRQSQTSRRSFSQAPALAHLQEIIWDVFYARLSRWLWSAVRLPP